MIYLIGSILLIIFLFFVYALCKIAAAADKAEEIIQIIFKNKTDA